MKKNALNIYVDEGDWPGFPDIKVEYHRRLDDLLEEYFKGMGLELEDVAEIGGETKDGKEMKMDLAKMKKSIHSEGCWGYYDRDMNKIHVWARKSCRLDMLTALIAHEVGHTHSPIKRDEIEEEKKATRYEITALFAVQIAQKIKSRL